MLRVSKKDDLKMDTFRAEISKERNEDGTLEQQVERQNFLFLNKIFVENILIKQFKMAVNFRIRGIERILKKRGALGFLLNFGSNFGDITGAEFIFSALDLAGLNET